MQISLIQTEIEDAVKEYINSFMSIAQDKEINMEFFATRGANGLTANITISNKKTEPEEVVTTKPEDAQDPITKDILAMNIHESEEEVTEEKKEEVVPPSPRKTLFANLK